MSRSSGRRRDGTPLWIPSAATATPLSRVEFQSSGDGRYNEDWLQSLLHERPECLPIDQIEAGFGPLIPVCRELPLEFGAGRTGQLDNFFITPSGGLVLVEAKLWRNPEARRSVVAQAMEYAASVFRLSFSGLENAVLRARTAKGEEPRSLFKLASANSDLDEAAFVDAISRNLERGRAIIAVVGDGIREDILPLAELLQSHAGHRFTFALIELAVYHAPDGTNKIIVPSILAQTALIERGVVRLEDATPDGVRFSVSTPSESRSGAPKFRSFGITEDEFFDTLRQRDPALPALLRSFLAKADAIGIYPDVQGGMNLKHEAPQGRPLNLGTIRKDGYVDTAPSTWWGRTAIGQAYNDRLAALIGGHVQPNKSGTESAVRTANKTTPRLSDFLPRHEDAWLTAIEAYLNAAEALYGSDQ